MAAPLQYVEASHSLIYCSVDGHDLERHDERKDLQHLIFVLASLGGPFDLITLAYLPPSLYHATYLRCNDGFRQSLAPVSQSRNKGR